jgi:hypothetical protein
MAAPDFFLGQGDLEPLIEDRLVDDQGDPIQLDPDNDRVFALWQRKDRSDVLHQAQGAILALDPEDLTSPNVQYAWQAGDSDIVGDYDFQWRVLFADGKILTVPNDRTIWLQITRSLGTVTP